MGGAALLPTVRDDRAVRGVGALMRDFLGVSVVSFRRPLRLGVDSVLFEVDVSTLGRRPPVTKGCRKAEAGLIRRSGSQTRHLEIKSTKSSSLHRST